MKNLVVYGLDMGALLGKAIEDFEAEIDRTNKEETEGQLWDSQRINTGMEPAMV